MGDPHVDARPTGHGGRQPALRRRPPALRARRLDPPAALTVLAGLWPAALLGLTDPAVSSSSPGGNYDDPMTASPRPRPVRRLARVAPPTIAAVAAPGRPRRRPLPARRRKPLLGWLAVGGPRCSPALALLPLRDGDRRTFCLHRPATARVQLRRRPLHPRHPVPGARRRRCSPPCCPSTHRPRRQAARRRVLVPAAVLGRRRRPAARLPRPRHPRRRPGGRLAARLRARRPAARRPALRRGGAEVLPLLGHRHRRDAARRQLPLRGHRHPAPRAGSPTRLAACRPAAATPWPRPASPSPSSASPSRPPPSPSTSGCRTPTSARRCPSPPTSPSSARRPASPASSCVSVQRLPRRTATLWGPALAVLAALTMTVGNAAALRQRPEPRAQRRTPAGLVVRRPGRLPAGAARRRRRYADDPGARRSAPPSRTP